MNEHFSKWPYGNRVFRGYLFAKRRATKFLAPPTFKTCITHSFFNTKYEQYLNPSVSALLKVPHKFSEKKKIKFREKLAEFLPLNTRLPHMK